MNQTVEIYGDLLFLLQFWWNLLLLFLAEVIGQYHLGMIRKTLSAVFLSGISLVALCFSEFRWFMLLAGAIGLFLLAGHWKIVFSYLMVSALAGGCWMIFPVKGYLPAVVGMVATLSYLKYCNQTDFYTVCCQNNGKKIKLQALRDTGNNLHVPNTGQPVSLAVWDCIAPIIDWEKLEKAVVIPYSSVGESDGYLLAIQMEALIIPEKNRIIKHPYIGIVHRPLSNDGSYEMILHKEIL